MDAPMTDDFVMTLIERKSKDRNSLDMIYSTLKCLSFDAEAYHEKADMDTGHKFIALRNDIHDFMDHIEDIFEREGWWS